MTCPKQTCDPADPTAHGGTLVTGSGSVFINNQAAGRFLDDINGVCSSVAAEGSPTVFVNGRAMVRFGDCSTGHGGSNPDCYPPRPNIEGSTDVFANSLGAHRKGDEWDIHCCPESMSSVESGEECPCWSRYESTWDCDSLSWGEPVFIGNECLPAAQMQWTAMPGAGNECKVYVYVLIDATCGVDCDGSCPDSEIEGAAPPNPNLPEPQGCCEEQQPTCYPCGDCCFSDQSYISFVRPSLVYNGTDPFEEALVDAYNQFASTVELAFDGLGLSNINWVASELFTYSGDSYRVNLVASRSCVNDSWFWVLEVDILIDGEWYEALSSVIYGYPPDVDTCCAFSFTGTENWVGWDMTVGQTSSGELVNNLCCKRCEECIAIDEDVCDFPEACPDDATLPSCLEIVGYSDGQLVIDDCATCFESFGESVWQGRFEYLDGCATYWINSDPSGTGPWQVSGLILNTTGTTSITFSGGIWTLAIYCTDAGSGTDIWTGTHAGESPIGVYTRVSGCSTNIESFYVDECTA